MSYNIDGKVVNQRHKRLVYLCDKCNVVLSYPFRKLLMIDDTNGFRFELVSYMGTPHYIYESKSGKAVVYCSKYCRNKHNHRFQGALK